jgi:hypothetical protein
MSDWLSRRDGAVRRLLPPVVAFMAAFAVSAGVSGGSSGRETASGAAADPVIRTPTALRSVEPLPHLRRPPADLHPRKRTEAARTASPQPSEPATRAVAIASPPAAPQATASPDPPAASPPASAVPPPAEPPPPARTPRAAPETADPAPVPPTPTFDSSGSFDSSG